MIKNIKKSSIVLMIITLLSGIGLIFSTGLFIKDAYLETIAVSIEAKVLSIDYNNSKKYATITYNVDGIDYVLSTPLSSSQEDVAVNENLTIKYNINNPIVAIYNEHLITIIEIAFISLLGLLFTINKSLKTIRNIKYLKNLKLNGIKLNATITDIYVDVNAPKKASSFPYRLRAKYLNPQDQKEYSFDSDYVYNDLKTIIKNSSKTITVYLDRNNTNIYYVDLNSLTKTTESIKVEDENNTTQQFNDKENSHEESK